MQLARFLIAAVCVWLSCSAMAQGRFSYSVDGAEVTDGQTGLIWRRCSAGQRWSGSTCTGTSGTFTHEAALVYAQSQTGWRLPNVKELSSIADKTRSNPAIDSTAFPVTSSWYWSSSPDVGVAGYAWNVDFSDGGVDDVRSLNGGHVRLVR